MVNCTWRLETSKVVPYKLEIFISHTKALKVVADLFGITQPNLLERALTYREITTGVGRRGSIIDVPLNQDQVGTRSCFIAH